MSASDRDAASALVQHLPHHRALPRAAGPEQSAGTSFKVSSFKVRDRDDRRVVSEAAAAFERIQDHRKLFRRDWLPFIAGVAHFSNSAWEEAGCPRNLDGSPDWTVDAVQVAFRQAIQDQPWADYFTRRRTLLSIIRAIAGDREAFLAWYDSLPEETREKIGYPVTLWRLYQRTLNKPDDHHQGDDDDDNGQGNKDREDPEDLQELAREDSALREDFDETRRFLRDLNAAVGDGSAKLPIGLLERLNVLVLQRRGDLS